MKRIILILLLLIVAPPLTSQDDDPIRDAEREYSEDCKEAFRAFFRQGTNFIKAGLTEADTLTWYESEDWMKWKKWKTGFQNRKIACPTNTDGTLIPCRVYAIELKPDSDFEGNLILSYTDYLDYLKGSHNRLAEMNAPKQHPKIPLVYKCNDNNMRFSTIQYIENPQAEYSYAPQAVIEGGIVPWDVPIDLSSEYLIHGAITTFEWFDITDGTEKNIVQPTNDDGIFTFTSEHADMKLRCKMLNERFPDLTQIYETELSLSIEESTIANLKLFPNPVNSTATLTLDLEKAGNLTITLTNTLGQNVMTIYNDFTAAVPFRKDFSVETVPDGVYFIRILHNGRSKLEKFIINNRRN